MAPKNRRANRHGGAQEGNITMNCYCDIKPMPYPGMTLKRLSLEAAKKVNGVNNFTERERSLLACVLAIRDFSVQLRCSMDENGEVLAGFSENPPAVKLIPGDHPWTLVYELMGSVLDDTGDLERFDPEEAESRRFVEDFLGELEQAQLDAGYTSGFHPRFDDPDASPANQEEGPTLREETEGLHTERFESDEPIN